METKVELPEPASVEWYSPPGSRTLGGIKLCYYTAQQLEDYAAARVAEALEHVGAGGVSLRPSSFVNTAGILASDGPGEVVKKLDAAWGDGSQWQPIETAPKDGTWIRLYRPYCQGGDSIVTGKWFRFEDEEESAWMWPSEPFGWPALEGLQDGNDMLDEGNCYWDEAFTHWQPLPEPPTP